MKIRAVPEHCKGEASKETKTASKLCDEGVPGVDEVLSPDDGAQRPISENNAMLKDKEEIATCQIKFFFSDSSLM